MNSNIPTKITNRILRNSRGSKVYSAKDFLDLGGRRAIDQALSRLAKAGFLRRIDRGLYDRPLIGTFGSKKGKALTPDTMSVISALTKKLNISIFPTGISSANYLRLTNAVPVKPEFLTDGPSRKVEIIDVSVQLKHAGKKILPWVNRPAFHVVNTMFWFGIDMFKNDDMINQLRSVTSCEILHDLKAGKSLLPSWASQVVDKLLQGDSCES